VESFCNVPWIILRGAEAFRNASTSEERSGGTKTFALAGKINRPGLIEVPVGTTIREIVYEIGGGVKDGKALKAVQIGGPSGGCVPASMIDTPIDYDTLQASGSIMGSGGLVVLSEDDCVVDVARYFMEFATRESCGKCVPCRIGTARMLEVLTKLCTGKGGKKDLDELERLATTTQTTSLCGLGRTAPNPLLSTLRHFREEYEAHLEKRCPAGVCKDLISYQITDDCIGCTLCSTGCPVDAIPFAPHEKHVIADDLCIRCDNCRIICPEDAITVISPPYHEHRTLSSHQQRHGNR
jgi:NADH-quinone oxidoreductase subunit F